MDTQLQSQLGDILALITKGLTATGGFVLEQLSDVAQQAVLYGRAINTMGLCGALLVVFCTLLYTRWAYYLVLPQHSDKFEHIIVGCILTIISVFLLAVTAPPAMLVWFAPKLWLIQQLASLIKG